MMLVGLYTSRVTLQVLGVSDFGVYNVVGGVVAMLTFLRTAMTAASQRFIAFELGRGASPSLKSTFGTSLAIHLLLAIALVVLAETLGLWFVSTHLNIDPERLNAAKWVYHSAVVVFFLSIVSVPYNAAIVAHEHMHAFAWISIGESLLKLAVVFALLALPFDKLIVFALLSALVAVLVRISYQIYCVKSFEECRGKISIDWSLAGPMFSFASWSAVGNLGFSFKDQCSNIILNLFFGTVINAARGVAMQVNGMITSFATNFLMAVNPQITKLYASGNLAESQNLVYAACRYSFYLLLLIAVPLVVNIDYILTLWLGTYPPQTDIFIALTLLAALYHAMSAPLTTAMQAHGDIKLFQIVICLLMLLELPMDYCLFKFSATAQAWMAMIPAVFVTILGLFARLLLLKRLIPTYSLGRFTLIVARCTLIGIVAITLSVGLHYLLNPKNFWPVALHITLTVILTAALIFLLGLTSTERRTILARLKSRK